MDEAHFIKTMGLLLDQTPVFRPAWGGGVKYMNFEFAFHLAPSCPFLGFYGFATLPTLMENMRISSDAVIINLSTNQPLANIMTAVCDFSSCPAMTCFLRSKSSRNVGVTCSTDIQNSFRNSSISLSTISNTILIALCLIHSLSFLDPRLSASTVFKR
jgi:hypothetical protein